MAVEIEMHRWYAVVHDNEKIIGVIGHDAGSGLILFDTYEEYEEFTG